MIRPRSVAAAIVLTIVTCGIYGWYWLVCMHDELNAMTGNRDETSGGMVLLFTIVTCGIYSWYWLYKSGEKIDALKVGRGESVASSPIILLVLGLLGFQIISYALIQDEINKNANAI